MKTLIGDVPNDWNECLLGEGCDLLAGPSGDRLHDRKAVSSGIPLVTPKDIHDNRIVAKQIITLHAEVVAKLDRYRLAENDIVCVRTGDVGRHALVEHAQAGWLFGTACLRIRPSGPVAARYLTHYLDHPAIRDWIRRNAVGSTIPSLSTETLRALPVVVPPIETQLIIGDVLGALDEKVILHMRISQTTALLRDNLLRLLLAPPQVGRSWLDQSGTTALQ